MTDVSESATGKAEERAETALRCPLCEYDLRGLPEPRCPECGHGFEWEELTDPARQKLAWFFEHRRWLGGYFATQWRMLRPYKFWTVLRPAHRVVRGRLWGFFFCTIVALVMTLGLMLVADALQFGFMTHSIRAVLLGKTPDPRPYTNPTPLEAADYLFPAVTDIGCWMNFIDQRFLILNPMTDRRLPLPAAMLPFGVWATTVAGFGLVLMALWQSRGRAAAKGGHLWRVMLYATDPAPLWLGFVGITVWQAGILIADWPSFFLWDSWRSELVLARGAWLLPVYVLWSGVRFAAGMRRYLGIPHAEGVALAGILIGGLMWVGLKVLVS